MRPARHRPIPDFCSPAGRYHDAPGCCASRRTPPRAILDDKLTRTLRADLRRNLPKLYRKARALTERKLKAYGEHEAAARLPAECPYTLDQLLDEAFYPDLGSEVTR
jgi:hypothetical protein